MITIGSGIRYDMLLADDVRTDRENHLSEYLEQVVTYHVSGRLKVAPEHTEKHVLDKMRKPSFQHFLRFLAKFNDLNHKINKRQQLIPYFISSHPGCTLEDMKNLARQTRQYHLMTEQVQDFTPTPMTTSSVMFWAGLDPRTMKPVFVERDSEHKRVQKSQFFKKGRG